MKCTTPLRELEPIARRHAIEAALVRMMSLPESVRPFVILEHRPSRRFVQFCGSLVRQLTFDVPALSTTIELGPGSAPDVYPSAASLALMTLGSLVYRSFITSGDPQARWLAIERTPHLLLIEAHDEAAVSVRAS